MNIYISISVALFILLSLWVGLRVAVSEGDHFILKRTLDKWRVGLSAGATGSTGFVVTGAVGMGYTTGVSALIFPIAWLVGDIVYWQFAAHKLNRVAARELSSSTTEMIATWRPLKILVSILVVGLLVIYSAAQFAAIAKSVQAYMPFHQTIIMLFTLLVVFLYSVRGGFLSSVDTDVVQAICMLLLTIGMLLWFVFGVDGSFHMLNEIGAQNEEYLNLSFGNTWIIGLLFIISYAFAGYGFSVGQPQVSNRILGAADEGVVKSSKWIYIGFLHFLWFGMCLIGMFIRSQNILVDDPESALSLYAISSFHPMVSSIILIGIVSAVASSLDSLLLTASNTFVTETISLNKRSNIKAYLRVSLLVCGLISVFLAAYTSSTVFQLSIFVATILASTVGSLVTIRIFQLPHNQYSLFCGLIAALITIFVWRFFRLDTTLSDGLVGFSVSILINHLSFIYFNKIDRNKPQE